MLMSPQTTRRVGSLRRPPRRSAASHGELVAVVVGVRARARWARRPTRPARRRRSPPPRGPPGAGNPGAPGSPATTSSSPTRERIATPFHCGLAVRRELVAAAAELVAEQLGEGLVGELGLLQADDVGLALVQPRQQPRHALLDRVDVPGRDPHGSKLHVLAQRLELGVAELDLQRRQVLASGARARACPGSAAWRASAAGATRA